jgi:ankyrin repeat protein
LRKEVTSGNTDATHSTVLHDVIHCLARDSGHQFYGATTYHQVAKLLIKSGADVNAQDSELVTPLHLAAGYGQMDMVLSLLRAGANPNLLCAHGSSALERSLAHGDLQVTRCLLENGASPVTFYNIPFEAVHGDVDVLRQLIELGADPYEASPGTGSTLTSAISGGAEGMSFVLNGNFDFYRLAEQEPLLLSEILANRNLSPMELKAIIKRMPRKYRARLVNSEPEEKYTPACSVILDDDPKLLQVLLDVGLDIEREWHGKGTPLMFAASIGAFKCFKLLVRHGARLAYLTTGRRGEVIARSVTEAAKLYPRLLQWALVDRHYETKCLTQAAHNGPFVPIKPWSGRRKAAYKVSGCGDEIPELPTESTMDLLTRVARMKRGMRGRVLPVLLCDFVPGFAQF